MTFNTTMGLAERTSAGLHGFLVDIIAAEGVGKQARVLDIGCGTGALINRLSELGYTDLAGIDYDLPPSRGGATMRQFDLNIDNPGDLGTFDLVTCIEVIEHIENVGKLLDCIKITLAPGGVAIISTPNVESLRARIRALISGKLPHFDDKSDPTHLMPILRDNLERMLQRRGLTIQQTASYPADAATSVVFGRSVKLARSIGKVALPDAIHGDNAVHVVRHIR